MNRTSIIAKETDIAAALEKPFPDGMLRFPCRRQPKRFLSRAITIVQ
ncbi:hypothetical protein [Hydrocoleum sp. CS-953]|nr:hypothetical protein [Hydrocoleum sp. CS-953]